MKFVVGALFLCLSVNALAGVTGIYRAKKTIIVWSETKESCKESGGKWQAEEDVCELATADEAKVEKTPSAYKLSISTIGSNYHTCEFEGPAILSKDVLTSKVKVEEYIPSTDTLEVSTCVVTATIHKNKLSISTNQKCQSFCGANAWLDASDLKRIK